MVLINDEIKEIMDKLFMTLKSKKYETLRIWYGMLLDGRRKDLILITIDPDFKKICYLMDNRSIRRILKCFFEKLLLVKGIHLCFDC